MALQIRRGLEADRVGFTPAQGELLYTTDDKKLYVGDGATVGGNAVGGGDLVTETTAAQFVHNQHSNLTFTYDVGTGRIIGSIPNFNIKIAGDDSTVRTVNLGETIKFSGTGGASVTSDIEGNIAINALTYNIEAVAALGGASLRLQTALSIDDIDFIGSGGTTVVRADANTIIISSSGGGGGGASNSFETIVVAGQPNVVADNGTDTLTLVAGSNITIQTNPVADSITINALPSDLNALTDVFAPSPSEGDVLYYQSGQWVNSTLVNAGVTSNLSYYSAPRQISSATNLAWNNATGTLSLPNIDINVILSDSSTFQILNTNNFTTTFGGQFGLTEYSGKIITIDIDGSTPGNTIHNSFVAVHNDVGTNTNGFLRARGTLASPTKVLNGDAIGAFGFYGYDGSNYGISGVIGVIVESEPIAGSGIVPAYLGIELTNSTQIANTVLTIFPNGTVNLFGDLNFPTKITNGTLKIENNVIETVTSNANLEFRTSGSGAIFLDNISINQGTIDTLDSSAIVVTPAAIFSSDVTVQNNLVVSNKVYAEEFVSTSNVTPEISAATQLSIKVGSKQWDLLNTGYLTLPSGAAILGDTSDVVTLIDSTSDNLVSVGTTGVIVTTNANTLSYNFYFNTDGGLQLPILNAAPSPANRGFYVADGVSWDPDSKGGSVPYPVFYDGSAFNALY